MAAINAHYLDLPGSCLFAEIARRVREYASANPDMRLIRLGIGDVAGTTPVRPWHA